MNTKIKAGSIVRRKAAYAFGSCNSGWPHGTNPVTVERISGDGYTLYFNGIGGWDYDRFELGSSAMPDDAPISDQIEFAKSLIGKKVEYDADDVKNTITVTDWSITGKSTANNYSTLVREYAAKHGVCVFLTSGGKSIPLCSCKVVGDVITVKLNSYYKAEISADGIQVGCQTFPLSIIKELADAVKQVQ